MRLRSMIANTLAKIISIALPSKIMRNERFFDLWEKKGYHVTPVAYYEPIPDTKALKEDVFLKKSQLKGILMNNDLQVGFLSLCDEKFKTEFRDFPLDKAPSPGEYYVNNDWFGCVDAEILYCMVRHFRPSRIFEIGSGYSTMLLSKAIKKNIESGPGYKCEFTVIDPAPKEYLKNGGFSISRAIDKKAEDVGIQEFEKLAENDILFIDSSHVGAIGSDVVYEYLEILPRLKKGVLVHAHDIFIPREYPREFVIKEHRFWNEQYILQAFLIFNNAFEVLWGSSYMHLNHPEKLEKSFNSYQRGSAWPSSFWMRKLI